jgi:hypothetical protein
MLLEKFIKDIDEKTKEYFVLEVRHSDGKYRIYVGKENQRLYQDSTGKPYYLREFILYAGYNKNIIVGHGRKSDKKLNKLTEISEQNLDSWFDIWMTGDMQKLADDVWSKTDKVFN